MIGTLDIDASLGLKGEVSVNATNSSKVWTGKVDVGSTPIRLWASSSSPDTAPWYDRSATDLGGGAVGLVPYSRYDEDCNPQPAEVVCSWPTLAANSNRETLRIVFYGPVVDGGPVESPDLPPLVVRRTYMAYPCCTIPPWYDITADCDVIVAPAGYPREVWVSPKPSSPLYGTFGDNYMVAIRLRSSTVSSVTKRDLRCAQTLVSPAPEVAEFVESQTVDDATVHEFRASSLCQ